MDVCRPVTKPCSNSYFWGAEKLTKATPPVHILLNHAKAIKNNKIVALTCTKIKGKANNAANINAFDGKLGRGLFVVIGLQQKIDLESWGGKKFDRICLFSGATSEYK